MANSRKKISELPALSVASLDTTFVLGISGSTTYKISINNLTSSLDTTFATDLVTNALSSSLNGKLSTSSFNSYTQSFTASVASGTISGSSQLTSSFDTRYTLSGSVANVNTASLVSRLNAIENVSGSWITESETGSFLTSLSGTISSSTQISDLGFVTGSYTTINSFNSLTQSFNSISQSFNVISGSVVSIQGGFDTGSYQTFTSSVNTSISNLNTFTASVTTASIVNSISNLNTFTASISTASLVTSISNLNTFTASQSTSSLVDRLNTIESVSGSWITESETGSFLTSLSGAISSSSQLTSSYDTRYTLSGSVQPLPSNLLSSSAQITAFGFISSSAAIPAGTISGSAQITSFGFVSGSYETTGRGIISSSANLVTTSSFNSYTASISTASLVTSITNLNTTTASLNTSVNALNTATSSYETKGRSIVSGSSQLTSSYDGRYIQTGSFNSYTSSFSSSLASSITSVSGTFSELTLNGSRINANGIINTDYINAGRITSDQTSMGVNNDIIFNYANVSNGISLNTSTGVFTLTANKTYKLFAELSFSNFSDLANGYIIYDWVDATTNTRLDTSGVSAGVGEHINRNTNEFNATSTTLIYTPTTNQTIKVRIVEAAGTVTVRAGIGTKATIEQVNSSFALNTISGGINYTQVLGNRRTGINSVGTSIISGSITTTGKPVQIMVTGDANPTTTAWCRLQIFRDGNGIGNIIQAENSSNLNVPYCLNVIDTPPAGTYTYSMRTVDNIAGTFDFGEASGPLLIATELGSLAIITDTNNSFTGTNTFSGSTTLRGGVNIGTGSGYEGGEIDLAYAQGGSTTLTGSAVVFDVYADKMRLFENGGTNRGVYVDLSKAPAAVGGELMWKASGLVNAGTDVTLGNLKVRMSTSGNRSLQVSTVTGTYSVYGSSVYNTAGPGGSSIPDNAPLTITTTPTYLNAIYSFTLGGYTDTWLLMSTANTIAWRINLIVGAGYNNNMISIERLF